MKKHDGTLALMLALAPLAACDTATGPATPADEPVPIEAVADGFIADLALESAGHPGFDELAEKIPGFAGYWFDRQCNLHVRLTDLSYAERAKALLAPVLEAKLAAEPRCPDDAAIVVQGAEFSWKELKRWAQALRPAAGIRGVTRMAISVPLNRIVFAVTGRPPAHGVIEMAKRLDVPYAALKFVLDTGGSTTGRTGGTTRGG